ncbi:hypothetical protein CYMTET_32694, partial [Cymbomonas tetramitiformis]
MLQSSDNSQLLAARNLQHGIQGDLIRRCRPHTRDTKRTAVLEGQVVDSSTGSADNDEDYGDETFPKDQGGFNQVRIAVLRLQRDLNLLDRKSDMQPQLNKVELFTLAVCAISSPASPLFFSYKVVELLVPATAALAASIGISAEYVGRVAVANGKEVAASALQAAAEAEQLLSKAERIKAVLPLCVGVSATCSAFALLSAEAVPLLVAQTNIPAPVFLLWWPVVAQLVAAISAQATEESNGLALRAIGVGNRRFASSNDVGRTWMSAPEQILDSSKRTQEKWVSFAIGVLPGPTAAIFFPGTLEVKAVVASATAAAQAAYYLTDAEFVLAKA